MVRFWLLFLAIFPLVSLMGQIRVEYFMNKASREFNSQRYTDAIQTLNTLIKLRPDLSEPHVLRGRSKLALGDLKGAHYDFTRAILLNHYDPEAFYLRGIVNSNLSNYHNALDDFRKSLERRPNNPGVYYSRGITRIKMKHYAEALADFDTLLLLRPDLKEALLVRAIAKLESGDDYGALQDLNQAIRLNIFYIDAYIKRGLLNKKLKNFQEALMDFSHAANLDNNNPLVYFYRGILLIQMGDTSMALNDFDRVIELDPYNDITYYNRGLIRASQGKLHDALEDFSKVLTINPQNVFTWYNRAIVHLKINDHSQAVADFTRAIEIFPYFAAAYLGRAEAYYQMNKFNNALNDREMVFRIINMLHEETDPDPEFLFLTNSAYLSRIIEFEADFKVPGSHPGMIQYQRNRIEMKPNFVFHYYPTGNSMQEKIRDRFLPYELSVFQQNIDDLSVELHAGKFEVSTEQIEYLRCKMDSLLRNNPNDPNGYLLQGILNWYMLNFSESLAAYDRLLECNPDYFPVILNRAEVLLDFIEYQYSTELDHFSLQLFLDGTLTSISSSSTPVLDFKIVIEELDRLISQQPDFSYAYYNRANIRNRMREYRLALDDYNTAIYLNPLLAEAYYNRALTLLLLSRAEEACYDLSIAGELGIGEAYQHIHRFCRK